MVELFGGQDLKVQVVCEVWEHEGVVEVDAGGSGVCRPVVDFLAGYSLGVVQRAQVWEVVGNDEAPIEW
eukprot:3929669-Amphidinium_carterae.1